MINFFRSDLPHDGDKSSKFIAPLMAIMVFLSILSISGFNMFNKVLSEWEHTAKGTITIQIPNSDGLAEDNKINYILKKINDIENVKTATLIKENEIRRLLEPWIGNNFDTNNLPLPIMIDVDVNKNYKLVINDINEALSDIIPDIRIDSHREWFTKLIELTNGFKRLSLIVVFIINFSLILIIIHTTFASIAEFNSSIAILHMLGANDYYIASQFSKRTFLSAINGSIIGFLIGLLTISILGWLGKNVESGFLPKIELGLDFWLSIPSIAIISSLIASLTSFLIVIKNLKKLI